MVWYNPIDDVRSVVNETRHVLSGNLAHEAWEAIKYGTPSKMLGDSKRAGEQAFNDLSVGNIWDSVTDVGRGVSNVFHDAAMSVSGKVPTCAWDSGQRLETALSMGGEGTQFFKTELDKLNSLWDGGAKPPGYGGTTRGDSKFYDDNAWIGIALVDAHKQNPKSPFYLDRAKQIFDLEQFGTQGTDKLPHPGGVFWTQEPGNHYRNTVTTAGAAQLALSLYGQTHDQKYLDFAKKQFDWVNDTLKDPNNNLFSDGIGDKGKPPDEINNMKWSYNQGLMLGDATLLYQATGDSHYLDQAKLIAKNSIAAFGPGGDQTPFGKQPPFFNAAFFKNLMLLDSVSHDNSYRQALSQYADELKTQVKSQTVNNPDISNALASAQQVFVLAAQNRPDGSPK